MANAHVVVGSGPTRVIALHGWFGSARGWGSLPAYLDTERFTYAFMDYWGYGGSIDVSGRFTMDEIAGDTLALADELGWDEFDLVGHSMGGMAAQQVLVAEPRRVRRVVALNGVPASGIPFDEESWALFSGAADSTDNRRTIIDLTTGNPPVALATSIEDFLG